MMTTQTTTTMNTHTTNAPKLHEGRRVYGPEEPPPAKEEESPAHASNGGGGGAVPRKSLPPTVDHDATRPEFTVQDEDALEERGMLARHGFALQEEDEWERTYSFNAVTLEGYAWTASPRPLDLSPNRAWGDAAAGSDAVAGGGGGGGGWDALFQEEDMEATADDMAAELLLKDDAVEEFNASHEAELGRSPPDAVAVDSAAVDAADDYDEALEAFLATQQTQQCPTMESEEEGEAARRALEADSLCRSSVEVAAAWPVDVNGCCVLLFPQVELATGGSPHTGKIVGMFAEALDVPELHRMLDDADLLKERVREGLSLAQQQPGAMAKEAKKRQQAKEGAQANAVNAAKASKAASDAAVAAKAAKAAKVTKAPRTAAEKAAPAATATKAAAQAKAAAQTKPGAATRGAATRGAAAARPANAPSRGGGHPSVCRGHFTCSVCHEAFQNRRELHAHLDRSGHRTTATAVAPGKAAPAKAAARTKTGAAACRMCAGQPHVECSVCAGHAPAKAAPVKAAVRAKAAVRGTWIQGVYIVGGAADAADAAAQTRTTLVRPTEECRAYRDLGFCKWGSGCRHLHSGRASTKDDEGSTGRFRLSKVRPLAEKPARRCRYWSRCTSVSCSFEHPQGWDLARRTARGTARDTVVPATSQESSPRGAPSRGASRKRAGKAEAGRVGGTLAAVPGCSTSELQRELFPWVLGIVGKDQEAAERVVGLLGQLPVATLEALRGNHSALVTAAKQFAPEAVARANAAAALAETARSVSGVARSVSGGAAAAAVLGGERGWGVWQGARLGARQGQRKTQA